MTPDDPVSGAGDETDDDSAGVFAGGDLLESIVMVMSVLLIVGVLGYLVSQAIVTPAAPEPTTAIEAVEPFPKDGAGTDTVRVTVSLANEGETGLQSVEVLVRCGGIERSLVFSHVPANGHRTGTVICPQGTTPRASVVTWIES
ncbi:hypothetical protein Halar_3131 [halophilic archaeon DL31]|jgi:hypothetical protein|nr:hypothetical protein Halar_3131 [halophilic archaeon DL31]